jgi:hypothetical protein
MIDYAHHWSKGYKRRFFQAKSLSKDVVREHDVSELWCQETPRIIAVRGNKRTEMFSGDTTKFRCFQGTQLTS